MIRSHISAAAALFSILLQPFCSANSTWPLSIPPNYDNWDGNDGNWSTFNVLIGSPAQHIQLLPATSQGTVWVVLPDGCTKTDPADCGRSRGNLFIRNESSTWQENGGKGKGIYELVIVEERRLGYTDFDNGRYGNETVAFGSGENSVGNQLIAGIATKDFYVGVLPLNPWPVNLTKNASWSSYPSLLTSLKNEKKIPSLSWGYTAGMFNRRIRNPGSLTLGGYDTSRFEKNDLTFQMEPDISRDLMIWVQTATVDGQPLQFEATPAFIDSTVSQMWLPLDACEAFEQAFNLTWNATANLYLISDELHGQLLQRNSTVDLAIGPARSGNNVSIRMPYGSFDMNATVNGSSRRYFPLKRAAETTQVVLGRVFLQNAYISANYETFRFNVSRATYPDTISSQNLVPILPNIFTLSNGPNMQSSPSRKGSVAAVLAIGTLFSALLYTLLVMTPIWLRSRRSHVSELEATSAPSELPCTNEIFQADSTSPGELEGGRDFEKKNFEMPAREVAAVEFESPLSPGTGEKARMGFI